MTATVAGTRAAVRLVCGCAALDANSVLSFLGRLAEARDRAENGQDGPIEW